MRLYAPGLPVIFMCDGRSTIAASGKGDSLPQEIVRTPEALARGQEDTKNNEMSDNWTKDKKTKAY